MESFSFYNINKIIADNYFFLSNCIIKIFVKIRFLEFNKFFLSFKTMYEEFIYIKIKIYIKYEI